MDIRKDDGFTPLHLAALNSHLDVVTSFAEHVSSIFMLHVTYKCALGCVPVLTGNCNRHTHMYLSHFINMAIHFHMVMY